ncbi:MAG: hypothetical protein RIE87_03050 [Rhodospirillales bacterium]
MCIEWEECVLHDGCAHHGMEGRNWPGTALALLRLLALLCAMAAFGAFPARAATGSASGAAEPAFPSVQVYELSGLRMTIPVGYLRGFELPPEPAIRFLDRPLQSIQVHAAAPDMGPPNADLLRRLSRPKESPEHVRIHLLVVSPGRTVLAWETHMRAAREQGTCRVEQTGDRCPDPMALSNDPSREALYMGRGNEFVFCNTPDGVPVPHCETNTLLIDGLSVKTFFDRRFLDFDDPVWERVHALVCSWINFPPGRTLTVDRCRTNTVPRPD